MPYTDERNIKIPDAGSGPETSHTSLPDQRLSPILNPLLANQLGRWAEIYYTTPVEQRDEAVEHLLRQLEAEAQSTKSAQISETTAVAEPVLNSPTVHSAVVVNESVPLLEQQDHPPTAELRSEDSLTENPIEDLQEPTSDTPPYILSAQPAPAVALPQEPPSVPIPMPVLDSVSAAAAVSEEEHREEPLSLKKHALEVPEEAHQIEAIQAQAVAAENEAGKTLAIANLPIATLPIEDSEQEVAWALEPLSQADAVATVPAQQNSVVGDPDLAVAPRPQLLAWIIPQIEQSQWTPRLLAAAATLVAAAAILTWGLRHRPTQAPAVALSSKASSSKVNAALPAARAPIPPPQATKVSEQAVAARRGTSHQSITAGSSTAPGPTAANAEKSAAEKSVIANSGIAVSPGQASIQATDSELGTDPSASDAVDPDLRTGLRYLRGPESERDSAQAVRYLWKSVGKQNGRALVELASLYAKGDGVGKDCDQAKVLLEAASRHKTKNMGTALETLRQSGCE